MAAWLALAALVSPAAAAGVVTLHLSHHHDDAADAGEARELAVALHGHAHPDGTARHDHPVLLTSGAKPQPYAYGAMTFIAGATGQAHASLCASNPARGAIRPGHGPPAPPATFAILRV